jgi:gentisate 1,2-dioxygenase
MVEREFGHRFVQGVEGLRQELDCAAMIRHPPTAARPQQRAAHYNIQAGNDAANAVTKRQRSTNPRRQELPVQQRTPPTAAANQTTRQAFYDKLKPHALAPLWEVLKGLVPREPTSKAVAHAWHYAAVRPLVLDAGNLLTAEEAERRVLVLENPALAGQSRITNTLYSGVQLILPGESAPAHRHVASALRFVLESDGAFTAVAGERTTMRRGDFIITPNWAFHDHGNDGKGPAIWVDGLDLPMINFFEAGFSDHLDALHQPIAKLENESLARYGSGMVPLNATSPFGITSPIFNYPYVNSRAALMGVAAAASPDPHDAISLRYANPLDGGWAMPTIATWLTHIPAGFETQSKRTTDGQTIIVAEGEVVADVGGKVFTVGENDILVVPAWTHRRLRATKDAVLFTFSDRSAQEKLGLYREHRA